MPPVYGKGGVWSNVEDEILRAAVSKYGLNQWARVSSLLARKTAKQAKARWTEYLDPRINKDAWNRREDEQLLHLAKIMPTQWKTIAGVMRRTANQCVERYHKLLDDAAGQPQEALPGLGVSTSELRQLRVGDIDPSPEVRSAKPDDEEMDDDELEMLAEARARLANTQGKKARRKERERFLEEGNRLALVQKRRQLQQSGVRMDLSTKPKGNFLDYNADIPLERQPAAGLYDTSEELVENQKELDEFLKASGEGMAHPEADRDGVKKTKKKDPSKSRTPDYSKAVHEAKREQEVLEDERRAKRRKLALPAPVQEQVDAVPSAKDEVDQITLLANQELESIAHSRQFVLKEDGLSSNQQRSEAQTSSVSAPASAAVPAPAGPQPSKIQGSQRDITEWLKQAFALLPKPKNDFEIEIPEEEELEISVDENGSMLQDAGELEKLQQKQQELHRKTEWSRQSTVLRKGMIRPVSVRIGGPKYTSSTPAEQLVLEATAQLIRSDLSKFPIKGLDTKTADILEDLDDTARLDALTLIENEAASSLSESLHPNASVCSIFQTAEVQPAVHNIAKQCSVQENNLTKQLAEYIKENEALHKTYTQTLKTLLETQIACKTFQSLADMEAIAMDMRAAGLQEQVDYLTNYEQRAQREFADLA